ncbi:hypothetical protein LIER_01431 [Lithospermum erythrorhizon]|uniref:Uncharacterized protein n=1 Tax=Lithospermum erythrorhizon TaxID=34254 RepID=A0AAV3NKX0_LITER
MDNALDPILDSVAIDECHYDCTNFVEWSHVLKTTFQTENKKYVLEIDSSRLPEDDDPIHAKREYLKCLGDMMETKFIMQVCMNNHFKRRFALSIPKEIYDQLKFEFIERLKSKRYEIFTNRSTE